MSAYVDKSPAHDVMGDSKFAYHVDGQGNIIINNLKTESSATIYNTPEYLKNFKKVFDAVCGKDEDVLKVIELFYPSALLMNRFYKSEFQRRLSEKSELLLHMLTQAYWMAYTSGKADTPAAKDWKATLDYIKEPLK